jgi:lipopolysaccharide transport system ATP-binding protein
MKPILEVRGISKKYNIHHEGNKRYLSLRDSINNIFKIDKNSNEEFWALQDISFNVYPGESVGIIGRNGAGKSTLLKILSKITPPSTGKIICRGRIASLLEVGTGFHSELSGRENIFLNGSILGLKKREIERQFEAIVDFSGVERFLDTPLKHYSSGMQLRLAFAVAAHLEPEIMIIDEVLAVGDSEFQKKCMSKMGEVSKSGRTILFVSHQLGSVAQLCQKSLLLENGKIIYENKTTSVIDYYVSNQNKLGNGFRNINSKKEIYITTAKTINIENNPCDLFLFDQNIILELEVKNKTANKGVKFSCTLQNKNGGYLSTLVEELDVFRKKEKESSILKIKYPSHIIAPGSYTFRLALFNPQGEVFDLIELICPIRIQDNGSKLSMFEGMDYGNFILAYDII